MLILSKIDVFLMLYNWGKSSIFQNIMFFTRHSSGLNLIEDQNDRNSKIWKSEVFDKKSVAKSKSTS